MRQKTWLLLAAAGAAVYFLTRVDKRKYLVEYFTNKSSHPTIVQRLPLMTDAEIAVFYDFVKRQGPADLLPQIEQLELNYNFSLS
jgi:hypothetical protein